MKELHLDRACRPRARRDSREGKSEATPKKTTSKTSKGRKAKD